MGIAADRNGSDTTISSEAVFSEEMGRKAIILFHGVIKAPGSLYSNLTHFQWKQSDHTYINRVALNGSVLFTH